MHTLLILMWTALLAAAPIADTAGAPASGSNWRFVASMHMARDEFGLAQAGDRIYAIGGMTGPLGTTLASNEAYDPSSDDWQTLPPLPLARRAVRATAVGHTVYAIGGSTDDNVTVARVDAFDPDTQTWSEKAPLPSPVQAPGVI